MRALLSAVILGVAGTLAAPAFADGDALKAGKRVYMTKTCLACHGRNGAKPVLSYPALAGQNEKYLVAQLKIIQEGGRVGNPDPSTGHPFITGMANIMHLLTADDIKNVAKYLAAQPAAAPETLDPAPEQALLDEGEARYKKLGCKACHGKDGTKATNKAYPILAALDRDYLVRQMTEMRDKVRTGGKSKLMFGVIKRADDADIKAIATWLSQVERPSK